MSFKKQKTNQPFGQVSLTQASKEEPPQVKTLKSALKTFLETAWHGNWKIIRAFSRIGILGFYYGFMPEVARHRRSVGEEAIPPFR